MSIHTKLANTIVRPGISVKHQIQNISYKGFEDFQTPQKAIQFDPEFQYVYMLHILSYANEPLSFRTGKKVGRCGNMKKRMGTYVQYFTRGFPDACGFTGILIQFLQDNPETKVWIVVEMLDCDLEEKVKATGEQYWKEESRRLGYELLCK